MPWLVAQHYMLRTQRPELNCMFSPAAASKSCRQRGHRHCCAVWSGLPASFASGGSAMHQHGSRRPSATAQPNDALQRGHTLIAKRLLEVRTFGWILACLSFPNFRLSRSVEQFHSSRAALSFGQGRKGLGEVLKIAANAKRFRCKIAKTFLEPTCPTLPITLQT